jgi:hypothetical protein
MYLRGGAFYCSLSPNEGDFLEVPVNAFKHDPTITNIDDLEHLLEILRYWMVTTPPTELLEYCLVTCATVEDCKLTLSRYQREFPYVKFLARNIRNTNGGAPQIHEALACDSIDIVRYVWVHYVPTTRGFQCFQGEFRKTLEGDSVDSLAFIISKGCPVYSRGVYARSRACLDYILATCPQYIPDFNTYVLTNRTDLVCYLLYLGYKWNSSSLLLCAEHNLPTMLACLHEHGCNEWGGVCTTACHAGNMEILQYALAHGTSWDSCTTRYCCDKTEFLVYAHEHGCAWHSGTLRGIVACRNWEGFKYALKNGCPYTADVAVAIVQHCPTLFNYLRNRGYAWNAQSCLDKAIRTANQSLVRKLRGEGVAWPPDALVAIAANGNVAMLQFAYEDGLLFDAPEACAQAARQRSANGLAKLRFLHEHGCPWDHTAVVNADRHRSEHCLTYLLQHGCPLPSTGRAERPLSCFSHALHSASATSGAQEQRLLGTEGVGPVPNHKMIGGVLLSAVLLTTEAALVAVAYRSRR